MAEQVILRISVQPAGEVGAGSQPVSQLSGRSQHQPVRAVTPRPNAFIQKVTIRSCLDERGERARRALHVSVV